jgi:4a-hydroxytetrahydrobiopterin dehydratase
MPQLSRERIEAELAGLPGWSFDGGALVKTFRFAGFVEAVAFVSRLVPGAEAADHHPDLSISYRTVIVSWTTHSEGGVTDKDLAGVRMTEACAGSCS